MSAPAPRVLLLNPVAPGARARPELASLIGRAAAAEVRVTAGPGDAARLAAEAVRDGARTLVVAGGDGTVHEVVNGLADAGARDRIHGGPPLLALLPLGTGNDLAVALGIPPELEAALELLETGVPRPLDVVRVEGLEDRRVANFAMGGFAGRIGEWVTPARRRRWGRHVYLRAAVDEVIARRRWRVRVRVDGEPVGPAQVHAVLVANGPRFGGGIPMAPGARPDDGLVDVLVLAAVPLPALLRVIGRALRGRHLEDPAVLHVRGRRVEVDAPPDLPWNGDGEMLGAGSAAFELLPGALRVLVPSGNLPRGDTCRSSGSRQGTTPARDPRVRPRGHSPGGHR